MKKTLSILIVSFTTLIMYCNPIVYPVFSVQKLSFDCNNKWIIECKYIRTLENEIKNVFVSSSTETSILRDPKKISEIYKITNDSLNFNVNINPEGDSISVTAIYTTWQGKYDTITESIVFGNYNNAIIPKPLKGQSIARFTTTLPNFCIEDSLGKKSGKIHGHIYDKNNNLITEGFFVLTPYLTEVYCPGTGYKFRQGVDIQKDGSFTISLPSLRYSISNIGKCTKDSCSPSIHDVYYIRIGTTPITALNFNVDVNSDTELDIHLLGDFTGIEKAEYSAVELLKIHPNPIRGNSINYELHIPVLSTNCSLNLLNINGQLIKTYKIESNIGELILPDNITSGTYLIQLNINRKNFSSVKIVVSK